MDRRQLILYLGSLGVVAVSDIVMLRSVNTTDKTVWSANTEKNISTIAKYTPEKSELDVSHNFNDDDIRDLLYKQKHFTSDYESDIFIEKELFYTLKRLSRRLNRAKYVIGYANFSIVGYHALIRYANNYPAIGKFTADELGLMDVLLQRSASDYGFYGDKLIYNLNDNIKLKHIIKISGTGQYLFKGSATKLLQRIQQDLGDNVILTSGVRGVVKQMQLFANKAVKTAGNLSKASRSIAPPGHSYHGVGDFDIGELGLGAGNFTDEFSKTEIFRKLTTLGYVDIRYKSDSFSGVRYEPWHIKVINNA